MTGRDTLITRLRARLDTAAATDLLARAVQAASVTGDEANMVAMLRPEMERLRLSPRVEEFLAGRPNISGRRPGQEQVRTCCSLGIPMWSTLATGGIIGLVTPNKTRLVRQSSMANFGGVVLPILKQAYALRWPRWT